LKENFIDRVEVGFKDHPEGVKKVIVDKEIFRDKKNDVPPPPPPPLKPKTESSNEKKDTPTFSRENFDKEVHDKIKPGVMPSDIVKEKKKEKN
jgi:hypothetical protein